MADLLDHQFELDGVPFGIGCSVTVENEGWDTGTADWRTQDEDLPQEDGRLFGQDRLTPPTWAWDLSTDMQDEAGALAALDQIATAWRGDAYRNVPGAVGVLRYRLAGRTRRVYGRPRRFSPSLSNRMLGGYIPITADFALADGVPYDDIEQSITISTVPASTHGFKTPFIFPLSTMRSNGYRQSDFRVGGSFPTWLKVEIHGEIINPVIIIDNAYRIPLRGTIAPDASVILDGRPWVRTAVRNDGVAVPGMLTRGARLANLKLRPGQHSVALDGITPGNATARLSWRSAYSSL